MILPLLLCLLVLAYGVALEYLRRQWQAIPVVLPEQKVPLQHTISLVVVIRNEARNLPSLFSALTKQTLQTEFFELHLVDDASTDESWQIAETFQKGAPFLVRLHALEMSFEGGSPKKAAITQVLPHTKGSVIAVTDGDCQPEASWLALMLQMWQDSQPVFVSGPVRYVGERNLFERLQALDFAALIGVGGALLQAGKPGMCNAANMAFDKNAFREVGGYSGNAHVPSGDDEFLLQKMAERFPGRISFLKSPNAIVSTRACKSWHQFVQQRKRWAGKWRLHQGVVNRLSAVLVFVFYLLLSLALFIPMLMPGQSILLFSIALLIKAVADYRFLSPVFHFLKKPLSLWVFLLLELVYPFYVLFFAFAANVGSFTWKERSYRYTSAAHERT